MFTMFTMFTIKYLNKLRTLTNRYYLVLGRFMHLKFALVTGDGGTDDLREEMDSSFARKERCQTKRGEAS